MAFGGKMLGANVCERKIRLMTSIHHQRDLDALDAHLRHRL
jgi:hypothetical protein